MLEISAVTITIVQTRPHPQSTFRSGSVSTAIVFLALIEKTCLGCWRGWAGSDEG
jgi:hypothetical protein